MNITICLIVIAPNTARKFHIHVWLKTYSLWILAISARKDVWHQNNSRYNKALSAHLLLVCTMVTTDNPSSNIKVFYKFQILLQITETNATSLLSNK